MKSILSHILVVCMYGSLLFTLPRAKAEELTGWQAEKAYFENILGTLPEAPPTVQTYWRSPTELWIYDARPEMGIGLHAGTPEQLDMIRKLGIRFVRRTMYWSNCEQTEEPGNYNNEYLAEWDEFTKLAKEKGIELLVVVHNNAPGTGWTNRHESYQRFANFMADMARRYPSIHYWELWNEMDVAFTDLFGKDDPNVTMSGRGKAYAEMLKLTYPAIKSANPDAWVVMGGLVTWEDFPRGVYENDGRDFFDIMNLHTYGVPVNWGFLGRGYKLKSLMAEYNDENKPLWNTEFGIDAGNVVNAHGFPHDQGKNDAETFDQNHLATWKSCVEIARKSGLYQKYLAFQFHAENESGPSEIKTQAYADQYLPPNMTIDDYGFGLVRKDGLTPRPTYEWLLKKQPNKEIIHDPIRKADVSITFTGFVPVDYEFTREDKILIIKNVNIDGLQPTRVKFRRILTRDPGSGL